MISWTVAGLATVAGAALSAEADGTAEVTGLTIDSRLAGPGVVFVALEGANAHGAEFAPEAVGRGSPLVVTDRPVAGPMAFVDDPVKALGQITEVVIRRLRAANPDLKVTALTGSAGKTTTKDLLALVAATQGPTVASEGSFNNHLGVPLTAARADATTRNLVLELGANHAGEIASLALMAQPDVAVVLNVQGAHLGEFGSQQTIARTKGELVEALGPDGVAVLNVDDPATAAMAFLAPGRVVTFGFDERAHIRGSDLEEDRFGLMSFTVEDARPAREPAPGEPPDFDRGRPMRVTTRLVGGHQASNVLAALAAGVALGVPLIRAVGALDGVGPMSPHRMAVTPLESGAVLVDDSYNASPDAVTAAVKTVGRMGAAAGMAPTAVLAGMRELGSSQGRKHREVGRTLVREGFGHVYLVGTPAVAYEPGLLDAGMDPERIHFRPDKTGLARELAASALPGEHILLKGPHAAELWLIADDLTAGSEPR